MSQQSFGPVTRARYTTTAPGPPGPQGPPGAAAGQIQATLVNGLNSNIATGGQPTVRIAGPTAAFSVGGFQLPGAATPQAGQQLVLTNPTAYSMTIVDEDASSTATNRITVGAGAPATVPANAQATFVYDGSASRWVLQNGGLVYRTVTDPREYGVKSDGSTDDTAAWAAAQAATPSGGTILVPVGVSIVSASFVITTAGLTFRGHGRKSIIRAANNTFHMFLLEANDLAFERFAVEGGTTVDSGTVAPGQGQFAFFTNAVVYSPTDCSWDHVYISGPVSSPQQGFNNGIKADSNCTDWSISKCRFEYLIGANGTYGSGYGILLGQASRITVDGCRFQGNTSSSPVQMRHAIYFSAGCSDCWATNNFVDSTNQDSIPLNAYAGQSPPNTRIRIVGNHITNRAAGATDSASISVNGPAQECLIASNLIIGDGSVSISMTDGAEGGGNICHRIDDNVIVNSGTTGINLYGVSNVYGRGNHVVDCSRAATGVSPALNVGSSSSGQFGQQPVNVDVEVIVGTNRGWSANVTIASPATVETWGQQFRVLAASNASPIVVQTAAPHGLTTNDPAILTNVGGNTAANGKWPVTVIDSTHFSLQGSAGNGTYTAVTGVVTTRTAHGMATGDPIQVTGVSPATTGVAGYTLATVVDAYTVSLQGTTGSGTNALAVTGATNAAPVVLAFGGAHGLKTGQRVLSNGVVGNLGANGLFTLTVVDSTHISLDGSVGTGAYSSGGTVTVFADIIAPTHRCALLVNSSGPQPCTVVPRVSGVPAFGLSYVQVSGPVAPPGPIYAGISTGSYQTYGMATSGDYNMSQYGTMRAKSALQSGDLHVIGIDGADDITFGDPTNGQLAILATSSAGLARIQVGTTVMTWSNTQATFGTSVVLTDPNFEVNNAVTLPLWRIAPLGTDVAPTALEVRGQSTWSGASVNVNGGDLRISGGSPTGGGAPGYIDFRNAPSTSSATAGAASALPLTPAGYMEVKIQGTVQKIPYYNV